MPAHVAYMCRCNEAKSLDGSIPRSIFPLRMAYRSQLLLNISLSGVV